MKALPVLSLAVALLIPGPAAFAEGIASWTTVKRENWSSLKHHSIEVTCKSRFPGVTTVVIYIRTDEDNPLESASVRIYRKESTDLPYLANWEQAISQGKPPHLYFQVADDLLDRVEVSYMLFATEMQSHRFTIKPGELPKLARLGKPKKD